jgi:hypothetical protein
MEKRRIQLPVDERQEAEMLLFIFELLVAHRLGGDIKKPADGHALGWFDCCLAVSPAYGIRT